MTKVRLAAWHAAVFSALGLHAVSGCGGQSIQEGGPNACFGLASGYAGRALGPGELSVDGALEARSFETIVTTAIHEACVGETLAALEAEAELARSTDPEVRRVLERIARDEARHAELGYRFLRWALDRAEPELRHRFIAELDAALRAELARKPATGSLLREIVEPAVCALDAALRPAA
jgi:hypothetical protein